MDPTAEASWKARTEGAETPLRTVRPLALVSTALATLPGPPLAPPATVEVVSAGSLRQRRALGALALVALALLGRLAFSVSIGLFLGVLVAFTLEPFYRRLRERGIEPEPSALLCSLGAALGVAGTVASLVALLVCSGATLFDTVQGLFAQDGGLRAWAEQLSVHLAAVHVHVDGLPQRVEDGVLSMGSQLASYAAELAGLTMRMVMAMFFMTMASYFLLRHWARIVDLAGQMLPFDRRHTHALLDQFRIVGRQVLVGTVGTGLLQGILAGLGYWLTGVRSPAFFGVLTAIASLVPGVGTALVWGSVGIGLIVTGHPGAGTAELIYGVLVVLIISDYVIRPRLVGRNQRVPALIMFVALLGGAETFGAIGLIVGPVLASLSLAVLRTYAREVSRPSPSSTSVG